LLFGGADDGTPSCTNLSEKILNDFRTPGASVCRAHEQVFQVSRHWFTFWKPHPEYQSRYPRSLPAKTIEPEVRDPPKADDSGEAPEVLRVVALEDKPGDIERARFRSCSSIAAASETAPFGTLSNTTSRPWLSMAFMEDVFMYV
jgi:hypothetical protein